MLSYHFIFLSILPVFGLIVLGFALQRTGRVGREAEEGMMKIGIDILLPCLILGEIVGNPILDQKENALLAIALGFCITLLSYLIAYLAGSAGGLSKGAGLRSMVVAAGVQNSGFLPIPIMVVLFGEKTSLVGLVLVFKMGMELAVWTVGLAILTKEISAKRLFSPPIVSVLSAMAIHYAKLGWLIPPSVDESLSMLGRCAIPLAILMIGVTMGRSLDEEKVNNWLRVSFLACFIRLGLLGGGIVALAVFFPMNDDFRAMLVIQGAMPAAVFPITLTRLYGGQAAIAICVVLSTSVVSLLTAPFVIRWGLAAFEIEAAADVPP